MQAIDKTVNYVVQRASGAVGLANGAVSGTVHRATDAVNTVGRFASDSATGAVNRVNRVATDAVRPANGAVNTVGRTAAGAVRTTTGALGNAVRFGSSEIITVEENQPLFEFGGDGRSCGGYNPQLGYTEFPERDYSGKTQYRNSMNLSRDQQLINSSGGNQTGLYLKPGTFKNDIQGDFNSRPPQPDDRRPDRHEEGDRKDKNSDSRKSGRRIKVNINMENDNNGNEKGSGHEYENNRINLDPKYERPGVDYGYRNRRKDDYDFKPSEVKIHSYKQEVPSIDEDKLNQLIELINEMPKHCDKNGEDKAQIQPQRGRPRESFGSRWESRKRDDGDTQSNFSFRLIGGNRKKFNWPKLRKSKAQADFQMESQMESEREMNANFEADSHYQADMDMVPRVKFNSDGSRCAPSRSCSRDATFEIQTAPPRPNCGLDYCSGGARMDGDCDCDGRFDDDVEVGMNRDFDDGFNRHRRFSGSYEGDFNEDFNGGMNNGGLGMGFNNGTGLGFQGGMQGAPNFGMNGGMNNGMGFGIQGGPPAGIKGGMSENLNGMVGVGNLSALSGLCVSLNALNGALGDLSGRLGNMNSVVGVRMGENVGINSGMISTGGPNGLNIGVGMQGVGGTLNVGSGMNFGDENISTVPQNSRMDVDGRVQKSFGGSLGKDSNFGRSMINLRTTHEGTSSLDVQYLSQSSNPSGNNRSSSVPPRSVGSSLNTCGMDDGDYEIQYIEPDMEEYNRKVKEAEERAKQKRQVLIRQRDEGVARKRAEMEKQIEEEYERRKAEAERQRDAQIKERISKVQGDLKKQERDLMQQFCEKLKILRDTEAEKRRKYESALAEANQRSELLKQQLAMATQQLQELEMLKSQLQIQPKQIQIAIQVPSYQSDTTMEKNLLADFSQKMCALKTQEQKIKKDICNVPMPQVERPQMPEIPIPAVIPTSATVSYSPTISQQQCPQVMPLCQPPCPPAPQQIQPYCAPAMPMMPMPMMGCYAPCSSCSTCCMPSGGYMPSIPVHAGANIQQNGCCSHVSYHSSKENCVDHNVPRKDCILSKCCLPSGPRSVADCCMATPRVDCESEDEIYEMKSSASTEGENDGRCCDSEEESGSGDREQSKNERSEEKECEETVSDCESVKSTETLKRPNSASAVLDKKIVTSIPVTPTTGNHVNTHPSAQQQLLKVLDYCYK
ncbi:hypothetical protein ACTXT7_008721 [Hymenolepis weldensis]